MNDYTILVVSLLYFFFNDTATTEIYTLSLHDALPILPGVRQACAGGGVPEPARRPHWPCPRHEAAPSRRSEEHTSELQSRQYLVCRLLLEKKKTTIIVRFFIAFFHHRCSVLSAPTAPE